MQSTYPQQASIGFGGIGKAFAGVLAGTALIMVLAVTTATVRPVAPTTPDDLGISAPALVEHRASERGSAVTDLGVSDAALVQHRAGERAVGIVPFDTTAYELQLAADAAARVAAAERLEALARWYAAKGNEDPSEPRGIGHR